MGIAESIIGPADGRTRWLHPSYDSTILPAPTLSSCPGLSRASTSLPDVSKKDVDGRVKPGHDGVTEQHQTEKWRRGEHRGAIAFSPVEMIRWSELHGHAGIDGRFGAGVGALAGCCDGADAGHCVVIEAELVLPVAVGNPEVDEVGVLRADEGLGGVEGQTDRFRVELGLGGGAETVRDRKEPEGRSSRPWVHTSRRGR